MATEIANKLTLNLNSAVDLTGLSAQTVTGGDLKFKYSPTKDTRFLLYIKNLSGTHEITDVTVEAGDYYRNKVLGNDNELELTDNLNANEARIIGPLESSRFKNEDGEVIVEVDMEGEASIELAVLEISYEED